VNKPRAGGAPVVPDIVLFLLPAGRHWIYSSQSLDHLPEKRVSHANKSGLFVGPAKRKKRGWLEKASASQ